MLERTPFYNKHEELDAKLIDFGGWEMPVQYESIKKEHNAVREKVGMFDVSHMGEFFVYGPEAEDFLQYTTINDVSRLEPGKAQYSAMCYSDGGIVDDLIVYMLDYNRYMLVVNASNIEKDFDWLINHKHHDVKLENRSAAMCLLAVQGPESVNTLQKLTEVPLHKIEFYNFKIGEFAGYERVIMSATGYTGEKGFEIYFNLEDSEPEEIWEAIMEAGEEFGIEPCGLGARDTLRLEMGYALYGNDITKNTNPLEARLGWLTKIDKGDFIGREALKEVKEQGVARKLVGFVMEEAGSIPRAGYTITDIEGVEIGEVTSGSRSITLGENIGMGYVDASFAEEGTTIYVSIRNKKAEAVVKKPPFVKKKN